MVSKAELDRLMVSLPKEPKLLSKALSSLVYYAFGTGFLFYHTLSVLYWSKRINEMLEEKIEPHLVEITAWLHDIAQIEGHEDHARKGRMWAKNWLKGILNKNQLELVLDGIENHSTSASPRTTLGHVLRFADAMGVWDPTIVSWALINARIEEIKNFYEAQMRKKLNVIHEYWKLWPDTREITENSVKKTEFILKGLLG